MVSFLCRCPLNVNQASASGSGCTHTKRCLTHHFTLLSDKMDKMNESATLSDEQVIKIYNKQTKKIASK